MNDEFESLFKSLEPVAARPDFMRRLREIPLSERRSERPALSFQFWNFRFSFGLAASLLLGLWFGSTELGGGSGSEDVQAFLSLDSSSVQAEAFPVDLFE